MKTLRNTGKKNFGDTSSYDDNTNYDCFCYRQKSYSGDKSPKKPTYSSEKRKKLFVPAKRAYHSDTEASEDTTEDEKEKETDKPYIPCPEDGYEMTKEEEEDASTDSKRKRIQRIRKILEEDDKRKQRNQERYYSQSNKHVSVRGTPDRDAKTKGSVRGTPDRDAKTKVALKEFCKHNEELGDVEKQDKVDTMKQTVRTWGWQAFKVLSEADFLYGSQFAMIMLQKFGYDPHSSAGKIWWEEKAKQVVQKTMQELRSSCTQGVQFVFKSKLVL
jgi:hypothetical protein